MIKIEVVTDREHGAREWAKAEEGVAATIIEWMSSQTDLRQHIETSTQCIVLTLIHRALSPEMLSVKDAKYIIAHNSLLSSFGGTTGMRSKKRAVDSRCVIIGGISHIVTDELDSGPRIKQAAFAARRGEIEKELQEIMFKCSRTIHKKINKYNIVDSGAKKYIKQAGRNVIIGFLGVNI